MDYPNFQFLAAAEAPESERSPDPPYVGRLIALDMGKGTMRFNGYYHGECPKQFMMLDGGYHRVRLLEKAKWHSTSTSGHESDSLMIHRIMEAAGKTPPFVQPPEPESASEAETAMIAAEQKEVAELRKAIAARIIARPKDDPRNEDDFDEHMFAGGVCFTSTWIIDLRFEILETLT